MDQLVYFLQIRIIVLGIIITDFYYADQRTLSEISKRLVNAQIKA